MAIHTVSDPTLLQSKCWIAGDWVEAESGRTVEVMNPSTGERVGQVPSVSATDVRRAIDAAEAAGPSWSARTGKERAAILRAWYELIVSNKSDLARIMTAEQGKPLHEAEGEITYAANYVEWFAEEAKRLYGETIPGFRTDTRIMVIKQPIGVTAAITPWNFPAAMITRKAGPALAAGCTMIIKPASQTPLTALALCVLAERAGVPSGVLSCVTGSAREIGEELTANPKVRKLSFTGSTEVGKGLMRQCVGTVKRTSMELGGNAPFIVFDDADLDAAVDGAIASKFRNAGQTCVCANRFFVQSKVHDEFVRRFVERIGKLRVGDGFSAGTEIGPLINTSAVQSVEKMLTDAVTKGAEVLVGGQRHPMGGNYFMPTLVAKVKPDMDICRDEIFGPVAPIIGFETDEEVLRLSNDTPFGLAAYFYGRDIGRIFRAAERLEFGIVGINTGLVSTEVAPFGGMKESGHGREGSHYGMDDYVEVKYLCLSI